jgi:hypothetical protein
MTNLCLVPLSCLIISSSSSSAAMRRLALASAEVGTAPDWSGSVKVWAWWRALGSGSAIERAVSRRGGWGEEKKKQSVTK